MKKYMLLALMLIFLAGCSKPTLSNESPPEEQMQEDKEIAQDELTSAEQREILSKYYSLLADKSELEEITDYVEQYISLLEEDIVDDIIVSLEEYIRVSTPSMEIISDTLMKYYDYASKEIRSFLDILEQEGKMMFTDGELINVELSELLSRAIAAENHIKKFPNGETYQRIKEFYEGYITAAIVGSGNQYIYAEDGSSQIKEDVLAEYKNMVNINKDSTTADILGIYLEKLELDGQDMNGINVLEFYDELSQIINGKI